MTFPEFNDDGDLPVGIYQATLQETLEHFGEGSLQRRLVARRLAKIYELAKGTNQLLRFIVYGSFVTNKPNPNDVDVFMLMKDNFDPENVFGKTRLLFKHLTTQKYEGASIFWATKSGIIGSADSLIEGWQIKRDKTMRGIIEVIDND